MPISFSVRAAILRAVEPVLAGFKVPGMTIAVAYGEGQDGRVVIGTDGAGIPLTSDSLFPVASISKLATALAALRLVEAGALELDAALSHYLPDSAAAQPGVTLRTLLSHTAGLPDDLAPGAAPYTAALTWGALAKACLEAAPERAPRTRVQYSNVGYGLIALLVERQTKQVFTDALESLVLRPLGIEAYLGAEPTRPAAVLSDVRSVEAGTPLEPYNSPFWRSLGKPW
jgi:CubicO group peptidase (beta-lactamase class C family)